MCIEERGIGGAQHIGHAEDQQKEKQYHGYVDRLSSALIADPLMQGVDQRAAADDGKDQQTETAEEVVPEGTVKESHVTAAEHLSIIVESTAQGRGEEQHPAKEGQKCGNRDAQGLWYLRPCVLQYKFLKDYKQSVIDAPEHKVPCGTVP